MIRGKKSNTSSLRHKITLQEESQTSDDQGGYIRSWNDVADVWAEIMPVVAGGSAFVGNEGLRDGQVQSTTIYKIRLRYRAGVTTAMRILYDDRAFNIRSVINLLEQDEMLDIVAEEGCAA